MVLLLFIILYLISKLDISLSDLRLLGFFGYLSRSNSTWFLTRLVIFLGFTPVFVLSFYVLLILLSVLQESNTIAFTELAGDKLQLSTKFYLNFAQHWSFLSCINS